MWSDLSYNFNSSSHTLVLDFCPSQSVEQSTPVSGSEGMIQYFRLTFSNTVNSIWAGGLSMQNPDGKSFSNSFLSWALAGA